MPIGLLVFIVFMIVVLQILQTIGKKASRKGFDPSRDSSGFPEGEKKARHPSLFRNLQNQGLNRVWMGAAGNYELSFIRPGEGGIYPGIGGESGGLLVRAYVDEGDQDSPPSTVIEVKYKEPLPLDFLLMQDEPSKLAKAVEGKPRLDKLAGLLASSRSNFALTGSDPKALEALFNPAGRNILEELLQTGEVLKMDKEGICWSDRGVIAEEEFLSEMLGLLIAAGTFFGDGARDLPSSSGKTVQVLPETPLPQPEPILSPVVKKEEVPPEDPPITEEAKEEKKEPLPAIKEGKIVPAPVAPLPETLPEEQAPALPIEEEKKEGGEVTLLALGEELFAVPFPDAAIRKKWEEQKGTLFRGEGTIKASYDYRSDFVFGSVPGVKVTLDLGKIPGKEGRMDIPYRAVISFPAEEKEFFRSAQGKSIAFTGKLLKFETFAREIYLMEGEITGKEEKV